MSAKEIVGKVFYLPKRATLRDCPYSFMFFNPDSSGLGIQTCFSLVFFHIGGKTCYSYGGFRGSFTPNTRWDLPHAYEKDMKASAVPSILALRKKLTQ